MNKVIMQLWEESERGWGVRPDGCSLHIDELERKKYIDKIYDDRSNESTVPDEYDRVFGSEMVVFVNDDMFSKIQSKGTIRIFEHELNNLISLEDIIIKS